MKTLAFEAVVTGKVTIPESMIEALRREAAIAVEMGGDKYLNLQHTNHPDDDEAFIQGCLRGALRKIFRNGVAGDLAGLGDGVGYRLAPAEVTVQMPERVVTKVKAREQLQAQAIPFNEGTL